MVAVNSCIELNVFPLNELNSSGTELNAFPFNELSFWGHEVVNALSSKVLNILKNEVRHEVRRSEMENGALQVVVITHKFGNVGSARSARKCAAF